MKNEVNLTLVNAHEVTCSINDSGGRGSRGYFKSYSKAVDAAKGIGAFNEDGEVNTVHLYSDGTELFELRKVASGFKDDIEAQKQKMIASITSKLSESEIDFLGLRIPK